MAQYIDKAALVAEIEKRINFNKTLNLIERVDECNAILSFIDTIEVKEVDFEKEQFSLQQENPQPYFYCKYGGTIPLCSDCKRNHNNSPFKTEEITTWYAPSNGTKHCIDYIQQKQSEMDL